MIRLARAWHWAPLAVPLVAVIELLAHAFQLATTASPRQWDAVKPVVESLARPSDLVVIAPPWADPLGREHLGAQLMTVDRVARADVTRFPRAVEVSLGGSARNEVRDWTVVDKRSVGPFVVRVRNNPNYVPIIDDLLTHVRVGAMSVARVDGAQSLDCAYSHGSFGSTGFLFGPALPADAFRCTSGAPVGITIMPVLDYTPRRCLLAEPLGGSAILRIRMPDVAFGKSLQGHHGVFVDVERTLDGAPVTLVVRGPRGVLGEVVHQDGDGWKPFDLSTDDLSGARGELVFEVTAASATNRVYCFEASTR
ncbi:MAG TPA: hypothetical protein VGY54_07975 [Polyangiaceae bacterium]|jgi:hypothetical protein|nr:hypothetical protein [Polyangiaceae bacterium]